MTKRAHILACMVVASMLCEAVWAAPAVSLAFREPWSNVFGGEEAELNIVITAREAVSGRIAWRLSAGPRTIRSSEANVAAEPGKNATMAVRAMIPPVKEGVIFQIRLSASLMREDAREAVARCEKTLWVFARNPFEHQKEWLKNLKIHLFDPEESTAKILEAAEVPFEEVRNVDSFPEIEGGILVVGEKTSFQDYRGLPEAMVRAAAKGVPVLCLAPSGGEMALPQGDRSELPSPKTMAFKRGDIITSLDKRLDSTGWPPDGKVVVSSLKLESNGGAVIEDAEEGGWPWLEMDFGKKNVKLVLCCYGIMEKWNDGPTPRFLFAKLLEHVSGQKKPEKKKKGEGK